MATHSGLNTDFISLNFASDTEGNRKKQRVPYTQQPSDYLMHDVIGCTGSEKRQQSQQQQQQQQQ
jgi:hypothetical protein